MCDQREVCRLPAGAWVVILAILTACDGTAVSGGGGASGRGGAAAAGHGGATLGSGGAGSSGHAGRAGQGGAIGAGGGRAPGGNYGAAGFGGHAGSAGSVGSAGSGGSAGSAGSAGSPGPGSPCRADDDCKVASPYLLLCQPPGTAAIGCGLLCQTPDQCYADSDCPPDPRAPGTLQVCHEVPTTGCNCPPRHDCRAGCRNNGDCAAGEACNNDLQCQTVCVPGSCAVDFTCGSDSLCHRNACTTDAQCSGACVYGSCYEAPGTCATPAG